MNYYKRHIGDYIKDTAHLSLLEHGVYTRLLDVYYSREIGIPDDQAGRLIGARSKEEFRAIQSVLKEFFVNVDGIWRQSRCDEEIASKNEKADKNREVGKLGGRPVGSKQKPSDNHDGSENNHDGSENNPSHKPIASNHYPEEEKDSRRGEESPSVDKAIYADARKIFGNSIGGQIGKAIKAKGKPWTLGVIEACRDKDPEQARAYFAAALNGAKKPDEAAQRRVIP
jgi:uncharacterized protein YdaU (DUF1376 family)